MTIYEYINNQEKELNKIKDSLRFWKCKKDIYMSDGDKNKVFTKGNQYLRVEKTNHLTLIDDEGKHHILGHLSKYFTNEF